MTTDLSGPEPSFRASRAVSRSRAYGCQVEVAIRQSAGPATGVSTRARWRSRREWMPLRA